MSVKIHVSRCISAARPRGPLTAPQRQLIRRCRRLNQITNALEAELALSAAARDMPVDHNFWRQIVRSAISRPGRHNVMLLHAIGLAFPEVTEPFSPYIAASLMANQAWICDRSLDAGYLIMMTTYNLAGCDHAIVFLIDELAGGIVRQCFVTREIDLTKDRLGDHGPLAGIGVESAHWLLARAYGRLDRCEQSSRNIEISRTRIMVNRRISHVLGYAVNV